MSGSSLDGLDLAHCRFEPSAGRMEWSILDTRMIPYNDSWQGKLQHANSLSGAALMQLDAEFGIFIGEIVKEWLDEKRITADLIASHGHTVFHEPAKHFTTQIGSGAHIAAVTHVDTITNFRQADIANGGQGAPLAPVADRDLFSGYDGYLNLGGIANVSIQSADHSWKAWDICPCNQAINFLATKRGFAFDADGLLSASGKVIPEVVQPLLTFFPPTSGKAFSLSNATVQLTWLEYLDQLKLDVADVLASTTEAVARLIVDHISAMRKASSSILVTGGGAHHSHLMKQLNAIGRGRTISFEKPTDEIIDFKESLLMAYLGFLSYHGLSFGINGVTGANHDSIGGAYYKAFR